MGFWRMLEKSKTGRHLVNVMIIRRQNFMARVSEQRMTGFIEGIWKFGEMMMKYSRIGKMREGVYGNLGFR